MNSDNKNLDNSLRLLAKSAIVVLFAIMVSKVLTYAYKIIIARYFGIEAYGLFSLATNIADLFVIVSSLGFGVGILRYVAWYRGENKPENIRFVLKKTFVFLLITSIIAASILFIFSTPISLKIFHSYSLIDFLRFFSLFIPIAVITSILLAATQAYEEITWNAFISNILLTLSRVVALGVFVFIGFGINSIIYSYLIAAIVWLLASVILFKKKVSPSLSNKPMSNKKRSKIFREVLAFSLPLFFAGVMWKVFNWADSFFIGYFLGVKDVGLYDAAISIASLLAITSQLFMNLFFPLVSKEYAHGNKKDVVEMSKQVGKWTFFLNMPLLVLMILFPGTFINLLFGSEFIAAINPLRFFAIGMLVLGSFEISNRLISMLGKSRIILIDIFFAAILNVVLNYFLVPKYGISGAAIASMISLIVISLTFAVQAYIYTGIIPVRKKMINIALALAVSSSLIYLLHNYISKSVLGMVLLLVFYFASYVLLVFLFKGLDYNDMAIIKSILKKLKSYRNKIKVR